MISAIETMYNGYRFRSRLEARWAVFFDALGIRYEYEPEGYHTAIGGYLPDFFIKDRGYYIEIKPERHLTDIELIKSLYLASDTSMFVLCGTPCVPRLRDSKVIDGPYALAFNLARDLDDNGWNEDRVKSLTLQSIGLKYPNGAWASIGTEDEGEILDSTGAIIGHIFRTVEFNGDRWRIYEMPMCQPDGLLLRETWAVHHTSGSVVHIEARPWLWHEWPDGNINLWCYPEYVPKKTSAKGIEKALRYLEKGDMRAFRPQQSVAKVSTPRLIEAYEAARSARFEHGETPRVIRGRQNAR